MSVGIPASRCRSLPILDLHPSHQGLDAGKIKREAKLDDPIEQFEQGGLLVKIYSDDDCSSPREDDNLDHMLMGGGQ